jgi:hypothetical protein
MLVVGGGSRLIYLPSTAAAEIMSGWDRGATVDWEVDDYSGQPHTVHLMPATNGAGFKLKHNGYRYWLSMSTSSVGKAVPRRAQAVNELDVLPSIISVRVPFEFQVSR